MARSHEKSAPVVEAGTGGRKHGFPHLPAARSRPVDVPGFHKPRRPFGDPVAPAAQHPRFIPPPFTNRVNLNLPLDIVLRRLGEARESAEVRRIVDAGQLVFHTAGDTGGIHGTDTQQSIAHAMELQIQTAKPKDRPAFFYHLGDVVYFNGQSEFYGEQFYDPYKYYPAPIFAIAGNHDGDTATRRGDPPDNEPTLEGFMDNFCTQQPEAVDKWRQTMTQPYVYWTLEAPFATIVGLYSNVDGSLDGRGANEQQGWLEAQLAAAPEGKCLIVAVHHPPYSLDGAHGGSPEIVFALDRAARVTGRFPDIVVSGHVHSYQRFTRTVGNGRARREIPYLVAGAAGYANQKKLMHQLQLDENQREVPNGGFQTTDPEVRLDRYNDTEPGYLRLAVTEEKLTGEYFTVPFDDAPPEKADDAFALNWRNHTVR